MNRGEIRTAVRLRLQDTREVVWTDSEINLFINDAYFELAKAEAMLKRYTFSLVDGTRSYDLPDDILELRGVKINGNKLFGTTADLLEELDTQYLTETGTPQFYYLESLQKIAIYPVPTWTDSYTEFAAASGPISGEDGVVVYVDGDTFSSDDGVVIEIIDDTRSEVYVSDSVSGETVALNDGPFNCQVSYTYKPDDLSDDSDTPPMPVYMHDAMVFYAVSECLKKEGQGQDVQAASFWDDRFNELNKEWRSRNLEWSRGEDQFASQRPVSWGDDLDTRLRVWP